MIYTIPNGICAIGNFSNKLSVDVEKYPHYKGVNYEKANT
ncbi:hypothetical protein TCEL_02309 [Thermobrachium celere DSM 8682]|uniref:Uncharacterized protein n=1 Tax=Thermobrachium celere DSM 8682 TaxID=941824 RepID=R7RUN1_9CLOT|nr:hypothetical protein TCEL_02309 [Thermobrachium celere DSM 8682]